MNQRDVEQEHSTETSSAISLHEKDCREKNDLKYLAKAVFYGLAVPVALAIVGGISSYFVAEAAQNEKIQAQIHSAEISNSRMFEMIITKLDTIKGKL